MSEETPQTATREQVGSSGPPTPPTDCTTGAPDGPWAWRERDLDAWIEENLREGVDYGRFGNQAKPSLLQPGAEKLTTYHMRAVALCTRDDDTWEMFGREPGLVCYVCRLVSIHDSTIVMGEGRGACRPDANQRGFGGPANKAIKMAEKSAQIDAVKRALALSGRFTQDAEDAPPQRSTPPPRQAQRPATPAPRNGDNKPLSKDLMERVVRLIEVSEMAGQPVSFRDCEFGVKTYLGQGRSESQVIALVQARIDALMKQWEQSTDQRPPREQARQPVTAAAAQEEETPW